MISIIIPFYNETENLKTLIPALVNVLEKIKKKFEVILVDDGSDDNFKFSIFNFKTNKTLKILKHRKRLGKGQALKTGIENASGTTMIFMDADWQDDPDDIRYFIKKIDQGFDLVNGKRIKREDNLLVKFYSKLANWLLKKILKSPFSDINCGFKAFKKEVLKDFVFYGNNFRFFPLAVYYQGYKVTEIPVKNNPRKFGQSKFGWTKVIVGLWDMFTALFIYRFSEKPLHFFGPIGGIMFVIGGIVLLILAIERIFFGILLYRRPILFLGLLLVIVGIQIFMTGVLGELIVYLNKKKS